MEGVSIALLLCWSILLLTLFGLYSWRAFRAFHKTLGTWTTVWTVLLITWTMWLKVVLMVISRASPRGYNVISTGITRGIFAIISAFIANPIMGRNAVFSCILTSFAFLIMVSLSSIVTFPIPGAIVIHRFLKRLES